MQIRISSNKVEVDVHAGGQNECDDTTLFLQAVLEGLSLECEGPSNKKPPIPEEALLKQNQRLRNGN